MQTVSLYKHHSGFANLPNTWSLLGNTDEFKGDFEADFVLPLGFVLGETWIGLPCIYDADGNPYEVSTDEAGQPELIGYHRGLVHAPLQRVA